MMLLIIRCIQMLLYIVMIVVEQKKLLKLNMKAIHLIQKQVKNGPDSIVKKLYIPAVPVNILIRNICLLIPKNRMQFLSNNTNIIKQTRISS